MSRLPRNFPFAGLTKLQALRARIGSLQPNELRASDMLENSQLAAWQAAGCPVADTTK